MWDNDDMEAFLTSLRRWEMVVRVVGAVVVVAIVLALVSCAGPARLERHELDGWAVVMGDQSTITRLCQGRGTSDRALGCADIERRTIYCPLWDFEVCGHELHHITHERWHK